MMMEVMRKLKACETGLIFSMKSEPTSFLKLRYNLPQVQKGTITTESVSKQRTKIYLHTYWL